MKLEEFPSHFLHNLVFPDGKSFEKPSFPPYIVWKRIVSYLEFWIPLQKKDIQIFNYLIKKNPKKHQNPGSGTIKENLQNPKIKENFDKT